MNVLLIYNPFAGNGRAKSLLDPVLDYCKAAGLNVTLRKTEYSGHAVELTAKADLSHYDALLASGGDGTLYEVVNGYYLNNSKLKPPIG
ncbi:MAG: acylglycerol kinase family protein, partial [Enterobacterales bacterium]|nr:acylglycerol kinase family protein [Enterobacterales bacterium]